MGKGPCMRIWWRVLGKRAVGTEASTNLCHLEAAACKQPRERSQYSSVPSKSVSTHEEAICIEFWAPLTSGAQEAYNISSSSLASMWPLTM